MKKIDISQEMVGSGCRAKCQKGDGLADLAIKALSHLIPTLLAKLGEKGGEVLSAEAIEFAKRKGLLSKKQEVQVGGFMPTAAGEITESVIKTRKSGPRVPKKGADKLKGDVIEKGVKVKTVFNGEQFASKNTGQSTGFTATPEIIAVPAKTTKGKKGGSSSHSRLAIGGASSLPGGASALPGEGCCGAGVFLAGDDTPPPKRRRGRPVGSGKKNV